MPTVRANNIDFCYEVTTQVCDRAGREVLRRSRRAAYGFRFPSPFRLSHAPRGWIPLRNYLDRYETLPTGAIPSVRSPHASAPRSTPRA